MSGFYADLQGIASGILKEFKQGVVTLTRTTTAEPNPATPWIPGEETTASFTLDATARGVPTKYVDGTLILASDLLVTAAVHPSVTPKMGDGLTIDGVSHAIKKIEPKPAAGTPVAFLIFAAGVAA
jgi:hypothetical protein